MTLIILYKAENCLDSLYIQELNKEAHTNLKTHLALLKFKKKWTLYFDTFSLHKSFLDTYNLEKWKNNIENVYTFSNVENFWKMYNNIIKPYDMWLKSSYYIFHNNNVRKKATLKYILVTSNNKLNFKKTFKKEGKKEDKEEEKDTSYINSLWLNLILLIIGGTMQNNHIIDGISLQCEYGYFALGIYLSENSTNNETSSFKKYMDLYIQEHSKLHKNT